MSLTRDTPRIPLQLSTFLELLKRLPEDEALLKETIGKLKHFEADKVIIKTRLLHDSVSLHSDDGRADKIIIQAQLGHDLGLGRKANDGLMLILEEIIDALNKVDESIAQINSKVSFFDEMVQRLTVEKGSGT